MDAGLPESSLTEAVELFRALLRLDTSNPPGRERAAADLLAESLRMDGIEPRILEAASQRANLLARLKGNGSRAPLMLTAHLDVVPADAARWRHPPFSAVEDGGWIWGRGAVDMKNMAAMSAVVLKALRREEVPLARDVILAAVADEEAGCRYGSKFLVDAHADEVRAEYALGELGGFTQELNGRRLYPIQVAQKGTAWIRARVEGTPGHGSIPREDNPVVALSAALAKLTPSALPLHPTAPARRFIRAMARAQPLLARAILPLILRPALADRLLARLPDRAVARVLSAILRNTATPTVLRAGEKTNVIPAWAEAEIDGRLAPGQRVEDLLEELRSLMGEHIRLEVLHALEPVEAPPDSPMFLHLERAVKEMDPHGIAVPSLIPGFTDAAPFSRLGIRYYGFAPIWFPPAPGVSFAELYHGNDERIPVEGFRRGLVALYRAVRAWCAAG
jgi:acetylornithine deacetylase/succinyl-diaminopimelate desuccinylase-like protein